MFAGGDINVVTIGQAPFGKGRFVPAFADDPLTGRGGFSAFLHQFNHFGDGFDQIELDARHLYPKLKHVVMPIIQTGHGGLACKVNLLGALAREGTHAVVVAKGDHVPIFAGDGAALWHGFVESVNVAIVEN